MATQPHVTADPATTAATLATERNRFVTVLQTMDQAVLALDEHQRVVTVNAAARSLLSLPSDVEGKKLLEAVRIPGLNQLVEEANEQRAERAEFDIPGTGKRVEARATRQSDGGVVLVVLDVTEIRRLERVRRDFVANVSHELRTPISVIKANAETLLDGGLDDREAGRMFVEAVLRHADRLGRLVGDLLDISRIEAGSYPLTMAPTEVAEVVESVFESIVRDANKKNIALAVDVPDELQVVADAKALEQVLINLVDNAVAYTPAGGHVEVRAVPAGSRVRVEVRDDGPGIDPAHRGRIFERFYRADPGRSRETGGTGLGLSIVKHLVEAMRGQVGVDPRSPRGSVFWFTLGTSTPATEPSPASEASRRAARDDAHDRDARARLARRNDPLDATSRSTDGAASSPDAGGSFAEELSQLRDDLLLMAGRVEDMIHRAGQALVERDAEAAQETIELDRAVNRAEVEIDERCLAILDRRQPLASDLRVVTLVMKMVTDLERIADLAVNICERAIDLSRADRIVVHADIPRMTQIVEGMVKDAIDGFVRQDSKKAWDVLARDDEVDALYHRVFEDTLEQMRIDPGQVHQLIHVQSVAKWLERMGDHSTNLAELAIFMIDGRDIRHPGKRGPG